MSKMSALRQQLDRTAPAAAPQAVAANADAPAPATKRSPTRDGKVHIGAYLPTAFKSSLRLVQAQTGKDVQSLVADALNELFHRYQVPTVNQD